MAVGFKGFSAVKVNPWSIEEIFGLVFSNCFLIVHLCPLSLSYWQVDVYIDCLSVLWVHKLKMLEVVIFNICEVHDSERIHVDCLLTLYPILYHPPSGHNTDNGR
jgi:hypothetical protein